MLETSARLLALLSLLQEHREWTGRELADRLEVGPRTIRRDIDRLRSLGYPVSSARGGRRRLPARERCAPTTVAIRRRRGRGDRGRAAQRRGNLDRGRRRDVDASADEARTGAAERLRRHVRTLAGATSTIDIDAPPIDPDLLGALATACRDALRARFAYVARDGTSTRRTVEPVALVHSGFNWYLVAFDIDRDDWRTFRVDRIDGPAKVGERGTRREVPAVTRPHSSRSAAKPSAPGSAGRSRPGVRIWAPAATVRGSNPKRVRDRGAGG